ncbi:MAG: hypothetical protein ACYC3X_29415 [Pirellulaceae bacterium]
MIQTTVHPITVRVTVKEVTLYLDLQSKRRALLREADALQRIEAELAAKLEALASVHVGPVRKGKYTLALAETTGRPSWKSEFIRVAGETAAERVIAQQPSVTKLVVTGG